MPEILDLRELLASDEEVERALSSDEGFNEFHQQTLKCSGLDPAGVALDTVQYSFTDGQGVLQQQKRIDDLVWSFGERVSLAKLLAPQVAVQRVKIIHAVWAAEHFVALKQLVRALSVVVRISEVDSGGLKGLVMFADALLPMIESVERREYVLANGEMASDSVTRTLGLRAKVFALDRARRVPIEEQSLFSRLTRSVRAGKPG